MAELIKVVIQRPGEISGIIEIKNNIEAINAIVGGQSTIVTIPGNGLKLVMNISSNRRGKPTLKTLWGRIYGTVLVMAVDGNRYVSLTVSQIQEARMWLLKHTYREEKQDGS